MKELTTLDKAAYLFLIVIYLIAIYIANRNLTYFDEVFTVEDGLVEWGSAIFLLMCSLLLAYRFFNLFKYKKTLWKIGIAAMAFVFFFGAGEEISWGQRIFNVQSSDYFLQNNAQGETNLHNMVVNGKKINKIIFSQLLTLILLIYLFIAPILYRKFKGIKNLATMFAVPIVKWHHSISFVLGTLFLLFMNSSRKWEVYELAFSVVFLLIFMNPLNKDIYSK